MNITFISDTHGRHERLDLSEGGDVLIHTGDFLTGYSKKELNSFLDWFRSQPYDQKILLAGNHDELLEDYLGKEYLSFNFEGIDYGVNKTIIINDKNFYTSPVIPFIGSSEESLKKGKKAYLTPYQPEFFDWAWNLPRNSNELKAVWDKIPDDTQILLTHCPPFGTLDVTDRGGIRAGCELLAKRIKELPNLEIHAFGHIHEARGIYENRDTGLISINSAIFAPNNEINKPIKLEI